METHPFFAAIAEALSIPATTITPIRRSHRKRPHRPQYTKLGGYERDPVERSARGIKKEAARLEMIANIKAEREAEQARLERLREMWR